MKKILFLLLVSLFTMCFNQRNSNENTVHDNSETTIIDNSEIPLIINIDINDEIWLYGQLVCFNGWYPNIRIIIAKNKIIGIVENDFSIELILNLLSDTITGKGLFKLKFVDTTNIPYYENELMIFEIIQHENMKIENDK
jgi:hypothetical protein